MSSDPGGRGDRLPPIHPTAFKLALALLRPIYGAYLSTHVSGRENLPPPGAPTLLTVNHASYLDVFATGYAFRRPTYFIAKAEATRVPVLGRFLRSIGAIPANRDRRDTAALRLTLEVLRRGGCLGVAPEGTRSRDGTLQPFDPGFAWLAARTGATVVPVAIHGAHRLMPRGARLPRRGDLWVRFGPSIVFEREDRPSRARLEALAADVRARTLAMLEDLATETGIPNPAVTAARASADA